MSRTTTRVAAGALLGLAVTGATLVAAPAAFAAPAAPVVNPTAVKAGETFTVAGTGCSKGVPGNPNMVLVGIDDFSPELLQGGAFGTADGTWTVELEFKAGTAPGDYEVHAVCVDYLSEMEQADTYITNVEYPVATVTVVDPAAKPSTPTTSAPTPSASSSATPSATPASTAFVPGAIPNTPGITPQATSASTGNTAAPGQKVVKVLKGFQPFERVTVVMHSTPVTLGTFTADAQGVLTVEFTLPAGAPAGAHTLAYDGHLGSHYEQAITVGKPALATASDGSLAYTGADVTVPLVAGAGLVLLGGVTVVATRRRKAAAQV